VTRDLPPTGQPVPTLRSLTGRFTVQIRLRRFTLAGGQRPGRGGPALATAMRKNCRAAATHERAPLATLSACLAQAGKNENAGSGERGA